MNRFTAIGLLKDIDTFRRISFRLTQTQIRIKTMQQGTCDVQALMALLKQKSLRLTQNLRRHMIDDGQPQGVAPTDPHGHTNN